MHAAKFLALLGAVGAFLETPVNGDVVEGDLNGCGCNQMCVDRCASSTWSGSEDPLQCVEQTNDEYGYAVCECSIDKVCGADDKDLLTSVRVMDSSSTGRVSVAANQTEYGVLNNSESSVICVRNYGPFPQYVDFYYINEIDERTLMHAGRVSYSGQTRCFLDDGWNEPNVLVQRQVRVHNNENNEVLSEVTPPYHTLRNGRPGQCEISWSTCETPTDPQPRFCNAHQATSECWPDNWDRAMPRF